MKKSHSFVLMAAGALMSLAGLTACSSSSEVEKVENPNVVYDDQGNAGVKPEFVISFPRSVVSSKTRMGNGETQSGGTYDQFRGMDHIRLIPFNTDAAPTGTSAKFANIMSLTPIQALKKDGVLNYKVFADQYVPVGTKHFLFYGKAIDNTAEADISTIDDKFKFGVIKATGLTDAEYTNPSSIVFSLEQINTSAEQQQNNTIGLSIVTLMTNMANTTVTGVEAPHNAWSTATNAVLSRLYKNFINTTVSSSAAFAAILRMINDGLVRVPATDSERALADKIKEYITNACSTAPVVGSPVTLKTEYAGYPANIGLPDGAARVRWDGSKFVDISANYGVDLKTDITNYVYPAALWYYVSTPLKASSDVESTEYDAQTSWANVIGTVYNTAGAVVDDNTKSVALVNPVQYAVGRIETKVKMGDGTFYDGNGQEVIIGSGYKLKGLLFGGQNSVKFDFTKKGSEQWVIYDRAMAGDIVATKGNTTIANQTLALETEVNKIIYAALELENGGDAFVGADGIIPAGGTFYLTVALDPQAPGSGYDADTKNKIVIKDHVTKVTVTIKNGSQTVDRTNDGTPDVYVFDALGNPIGVNTGDGVTKTVYDINGDGTDDTFILAANGGPGWDTDRDGKVDIPVLRDPSTGNYPVSVHISEGLGNATNGIPDLSTPGVELGTSVDLKWEQGLTLEPSI